MRKLAQIVIVFVLLFIASYKNVEASGCTVSVSPTEVLTDSTTGFTLTINNTGENPIRFVKIPTGFDSNLTVGDASSSGWDLSLVSGGYGMIGGNISAGSSNGFSVNGTVGGNETNISWTLEASENSDGSNLFSCYSVNINVVSQFTETPAPVPTEPPLPTPVISNVSATTGSTTLVLTWNSDIPSSGVFSFGTTASYGSAKYTSTGTSHSISLTGLTPSTLYHYKLENTSLGGTTVTSDNTFTTGAPGAATTVTSTVTTTVTTVTTNTVTQTLRDTTPPSIRYKTVFKKIYEEAPLVEIVTGDGTGIARIEYSTDGGNNYSPIEIGERIGSKQITSNFTPNVNEDGDYSLIVKATDTSGNKQISKEVKFTIDRLPPRVGPLTIMAGPIVINATSSNNTDLLAGIEYKFIVSAAGGPNNVSMVCNGQKYEFIKNIDSGVWITKIKFNDQGECLTKLTAKDGAENIQEVEKMKLNIAGMGNFKNGIITIYWYDDYEKKFVSWDGAPYGQTNPIETYQSGKYGALLPPGKYYLEAKSAGKRTAVSNIINTDKTIFINDDWALDPAWKFWQISKEKLIEPKNLGSSDWKDVNIILPKVNLGGLSTLSIRGNYSIVTLFTSWHPFTNSHLKIADGLLENKVKVYPILFQEKVVQANMLRKRGGYESQIYADPDGEMLKDMNLSGLPTTWIVNRFGQVVKEKTGEVTMDEILAEYNKLK